MTADGAEPLANDSPSAESGCAQMIVGRAGTNRLSSLFQNRNACPFTGSTNALGSIAPLWSVWHTSGVARGVNGPSGVDATAVPMQCVPFVARSAGWAVKYRT